MLRRAMDGSAFESALQVYEKSSSADTLGLIAEHITKAPLAPDTSRRWGQLFRAMRVVDNRIDTLGDVQERARLTENVRAFLAGKNIDFANDALFAEAMQSVRTLSEGLSQSKKSLFLRSLSSILKVTERIKQETDPKRFSALTRLEGQVTARAFLPFFTDAYTHHPQYPAVAKAFTRLGRIGNSVDTFIDLPGDVKNGEAKIRPGPMERSTVLAGSFRDMRVFFKSAKVSPKLVFELLKDTFSTVRDKDVR